MERKVTITRETVLDVEGHKLNVTVRAAYRVEHDTAYGADADGLRGRERWGAVCTELIVEDSAGRDITLNLYARRPAVFARLLDTCDSWDAVEAVRSE